MLRITQNSTPAGAKHYYSTADYYSEGQELTGLWRGKGAEKLGLSGEVQKQEWEALCDNLDPSTGERLTVRRKADRRVGWDFNFNVPKSVSVLYGLSGDDRIVTALRESVNETMIDIESEVQARVRKGGANEDRVTGNMVWGEYVHTTGRPVDGVPDPQLHAHCFVFNTTHDGHESRWKAAQIGDLKRDAPYFEAVFHSRLAKRMNELGLNIERTPDRWELKDIPHGLLERFSRRTAEINQKAKEKGISDPKEKAELGAKTRKRKQKDMTMDQLRDLWRSRMTSDEDRLVRNLAQSMGNRVMPDDLTIAETAVKAAAEHCFERKSVQPERTVLAESLKRSAGSSSVNSVERAFKGQPWLTGTHKGRAMVTTPEVLNEEKKMLEFARTGRGTCRPLGGHDASLYSFSREWLNDQQRSAVRHVLTSPDRVILIRGAAGVGKTSMMQEAVEAIQASKGDHHGTPVFTFAPSAGASRDVLRGKGFANADTVARLLKDEKMQESIRDSVIWIDEAGLVGTRTMKKVFDLADKLDARVVLSGDRRQHGSVERGAASRLLEEEAGLTPAEIKEIQRQKGDYKQVVRALSEERVEDAFTQLDRMKWIRQIPTAKRYKALAADYVESVTEGKTALVVSPTHSEGNKITSEIRSKLKELGKVGTNEREFTILRNRQLTQAQLADPASYHHADNVLVFHQNAKGYRKGDRIVVNNEHGAGSTSVGPSAQSLGTPGLNDQNLPLDQADRFQAFTRGTLSLARGDVIRITQGGATADKQHRLNNGDIHTIKGFDKQGNIVLENNWTISKDFGHLAYGYVVTSHASQGKDVQRVFVGQSAESLPASSREQFYVSVSRGQQQAIVYTDDKEALLDAVRRSDERLSATEFVADRERRDRAHTMQRQAYVNSRPALPNERRLMPTSRPMPPRLHEPDRGMVIQ